MHDQAASEAITAIKQGKKTEQQPNRVPNKTKKKQRKRKGDPEGVKITSDRIKKKKKMGGWSMSLMVGLVFMMSVMSLTEAQSGGSTPSCAADLIPCADYLSSPNPPASCCNPLKQTVATQLTCLCNLFYTPGLLQGFNISVDQALQLSRRCGVTSDISSCKHDAGAAPPTSSSVPPPPATKGSGDNGGAGRVSFTGLSFILLFLATMLFN